jgi:hypothetical protein
MRKFFSNKDCRIQLSIGIEKPIRFFSTSFANSQQEIADIHLSEAERIAFRAAGDKDRS